VLRGKGGGKKKENLFESFFIREREKITGKGRERRGKKKSPPF